MREINLIVVHCSATPPTSNLNAEDIRRMHVDGNGWSDIGYHWVIKRNGIVENGRDLDGDGDVIEEIGAHAYGFNRKSLGICLVGGVDQNNKPDANFTIKQYTALATLLRKLKVQFPGVEICGHRDLEGVTKACPCFDVKAFMEL